MEMAIEQFCVLAGITEDQFTGKERIENYLDLSSFTYIPNGFNPVVLDSLDLNGLTTTPENFSPTVDENLYLTNVTTVSAGFCPTVGESLYLDRTTSLSENFAPIIEENLNLSALKEIPRSFAPVVGENLWLSNVVSIPDDMEIIVGGDLDLRSLTKIPKGLKLIVGGDLKLNSLSCIPPDFKPMVQGCLWINCGSYTTQTWRDGKYIRADDMTLEVLSHCGNEYKVRKINDTYESFLVTDGKGKWAYGETLEEAKLNLVYRVSNWDIEHYKHLTLNSVVSYEDAVEAYIAVTTDRWHFTKFEEAKTYKHFFESLFKEKKEKYKLSEFLDIIVEHCNSDDFKQFLVENEKINNENNSCTVL
ncbi:hypothetical protein LJC72_06230 [Bacteroides sp. OttesenSCG-928-D19]|nr:hypothetical protein [Bacteroides sp. OttesenSCG-928-D19]